MLHDRSLINPSNELSHGWILQQPEITIFSEQKFSKIKISFYINNTHNFYYLLSGFLSTFSRCLTHTTCTTLAAQLTLKIVAFVCLFVCFGVISSANLIWSELLIRGYSFYNYAVCILQSLQIFAVMRTEIQDICIYNITKCPNNRP